MRLIGIALLAFAVSGASAQTPPAAAPAAAPAAPARPPAAGGRILTVPSMELTTTAWHDGGPIPPKYSQSGHDVSPPLSWSRVPQGTESFVIFVHDLDAANVDGDDSFTSWLVWNIPKTKTSLPEGLPEGGEMGDGMRQISGSGPFYRGPASPNAEPAHHYAFEIYALSTTLNIPAVPAGQAPNVARSAVFAAMAGKVLAKGVLVGTYKRA